MTKVTEDQFEFDGDLRVVHWPTGTVFTTKRYASPPAEIDVWSSHIRETLPDGRDFSIEEMLEVAHDLLVSKQAGLH